MEYRPKRPASDVLILGAGVIGLSLALELRLRGLSVAVVDQGTPLAQASTAAAGMLAVEDPYNPREIQALSRYSGSLYPGFLARLQQLSDRAVPFQTERTVQYLEGGQTVLLKEHSLDPRQLAPALLAAVRALGVDIQVRTSSSGDPGKSLGFQPEAVVHTTGSWPLDGLPIAPRKGQMLRVAIPAGVLLREVHRAEHIYVVPRTQGPQAGTALIGATVEDAGFDTSTSPAALAKLRQHGAELVPGLASERLAPAVEAWAGLRPATPDGLPILGELDPASGSAPPAAGPRHFVATGHFRNGILLAPATAAVMADLLQNRKPAVDLEPFSPARFTPAVP